MSLDIPDCQKTEYGTIPSDWIIGELRNILAFQCGAPFASLHFRKDGIGVRLIRNRDLKSNDDIVSYDGIYEPNYVVKNGDVLVSMDGDFIPCCWNNGEALLNQRVGRVLPKGGNLAKYLYYILVTPLRRKQEGTGATTVKHLSHSDVEKLVVPYTLNIQEQRAIATALADVDALIEAKQALLEKKRAIKQGAMQELLTGKLRLPGFPVTPMKHTEIGVLPEDWEVRELGSLVDICSAKRVLQSQWKSDGIPFYRTREIIVLAEQGSVENELYISQELYKRNSCICPAPTEGDIMLTAVGTIGKTYLVREGDCFYYKDASVLCLRNQRKIVPGYLNLQLSYVTVQNQINGDSDGTTVKTITINKAKKYLIPVPSSTLEQERIHEVIQDHENEIRSLQKELSKLSCIKQGMMQNLLTGRIRLV